MQMSEDVLTAALARLILAVRRQYLASGGAPKTAWTRLQTSMQHACERAVDRGAWLGAWFGALQLQVLPTVARAAAVALAVGPERERAWLSQVREYQAYAFVMAMTTDEVGDDGIEATAAEMIAAAEGGDV